MSEAKLTSGYPDTPEYRFAQWFASQSKEYRDWFEEEHKKSMEAEKEREKGTE
jgi:DNA-binding SARP family transcriptional activator